MPMASIMVDLLCSGYTTSLSPGACLVDDPGRQGDVCRRQYHWLAGSNVFNPPRVCLHSFGRMNSTLQGRCISWSNEFDPTGWVCLSVECIRPYGVSVSFAGSDLFDRARLQADDEAVFTGTCTGDVIDVFDAQAHVLAKVALQLRGEDQPYPIHKGWRGTEL